ncbi:MAG TPA: aldolase/citrate lyase family protein [Acidimicrobiia bacterium]|nr:aldolase/citrate lyase family protein [Acidimicrobiia bacterium]
MGWRDPREGNPIKAALAAGETVTGAFVRLPTIEAVEICAHAGCQFLIIDREHTPVDWERTSALILATEAAGASSIVRLPTWGRERITKALDAGADGVMIPQVEDARTTREVVAATKYGPTGTRGTATNRNSGYGMKMALGEYIDAANESALVIIQIESVEGVDKAEEIAAVDGVDCIFVGLSDLSVRLGVPGDMEAPVLTEALEVVSAACRRHGKALGVPVGSVEMGQSLRDRGARLIAVGDVGVLARGMRKFVEGMQQSTG